MGCHLNLGDGGLERKGAVAQGRDKTTAAHKVNLHPGPWEKE